MSSTQHRCVFVGNIPYDATEDQLIQICEEVGPVVSFRLVLDRETGKPKGYGFCEFKDEETALSARRNLQGYEINGRQLRVDFAENEKGSANRNREQGRGGPGLAQNIDVHKQTSAPRAVRDSSFDQPIGLAAADSAAAVMAGILGAPQVSSVTSQGNMGGTGQQDGGGGGMALGTDALTIHLAGMSRHELYDIILQMKDFILQNQQQAREILTSNPQLIKALFQIEIILGLVRAPQRSLQSVAAQDPQQQPVQQPRIQPVQVQNAPQLPAVQQTSVQQGQLQMPVGRLPQQLQQLSQAQNVPLPQSQHSVNTYVPLNIQNLIPASSPANSLGLQPQNPAVQHAQPQPTLHSHPPPLPQQPRPSVPPVQLQPQSAQVMSLQVPHGVQSHLPQSSFQQSGGMSQGLSYQPMQPPLPNQPPPQKVFQMSRGGADLVGGAGIDQGGLPSGVLLQDGRGPTMGLSTGSVSWNQLLPSSGSINIPPQATTSMGMAAQMISAQSLGGVDSGTVSSLGGVLPSNGAQPIQQGTSRLYYDTEGSVMVYSQGHSQPLIQSQTQQQSQQKPQTQVPLELEQQKALLQQVINLTPEQINSLPPEQRQQVLQLQQAFRTQST